MNPLSDMIATLIANQGPLAISDYMALALGHPQHGYYMKQVPLGEKGDFTTAPEISQMFGELIGIWCADTWQRMGAPAEIALVELGPGRGTLMEDILRTLKVVPELLEAAEVHFVETSPALTAEQRARVPQATWHASIESLPEKPVLLIANEFFDALPIRQFQRTEQGWHERCLGLVPQENGGWDFALQLAPDPIPNTALLPLNVLDAPPGSVAETCPAAQSIAETLGAHLKRHGGAGLIIDYGHGESAPGDTLQAVRAHDYADPFADPGEADLTAHVDFAALAQCFAKGGAKIWPLTTQSAFLSMLGIIQRAKKLQASATPAQSRDIKAAMHRLTDPGEMGTLFKVLTITAPDMAPPAGFDRA
jgi:NADH dehydrogenase [ubiquinone] 1 alpha subcomplex assembly factor 7